MRISLRWQVVAFLSLALVPLGIMSVLQTTSLRSEADARSQLRLLALTEAAASGERALLLSGLGAAEAMGAITDDLYLTADQCARYMSEFVSKNPRYSFAGFIDDTGTINCSSAGVTLNYADDPLFLDLSANPRQALNLLPNPDVSGVPVLSFSHPVFQNGAFRGFISLSLPSAGFDAADDPGLLDINPDTLVLFNQQGAVLTQHLGKNMAQAVLPENISLASFSGRTAQTFRAQGTDGQDRVFAVTPVVPGVAYAIASWARDDALIGGGTVKFPALVIPLVMWLASLAVASFAIHRLVLRHVLTLRQRMRRFTIDRRLTKPRQDRAIAAELAELDHSFDTLANTVLQDEAEMEDALREKNILLKEVHHRVKNNLQMISSIMSMNLRKANSDETREAIGRLQTRVLNLAAVHRQLYMADNLTKADAGALLQSVVSPLTDVLVGSGRKVDVQIAFDPLPLLPDQLVPLSLLAAEVVANATKHMGVPSSGAPWLITKLQAPQAPGGEAVFTCTNTRGPVPVIEPGDKLQGGLGAQLIRAFALQLGGTITQDETEDEYRLSCAFKVQDDVAMDSVDY